MSEEETLEKWLDKQIQYEENLIGMYKSYNKVKDIDGIQARLKAFKEVRIKISELWGI